MQTNPLHRYSLIRRISYRIGKCPVCGRWHWPWQVRLRRMFTAYQDDQKNFMLSCAACLVRINEHWTDMWNDYNAGRL